MSTDVKQGSEMKPASWPRRCLIATVVAALIGLLGYLSVDYWIIGPLLLMLGFLLYMAIGFQFIGAIVHDLFIRKKHPDGRRSFLIGISFLLFFIAFQCASDVFCTMSFRAARSYQAQVAPALDQYFQLNGKYPDSLDVLSNTPPLPRGLHYYSRPLENGYAFFFNYSLFSGYRYSNSHPAWKWISD